MSYAIIRIQKMTAGSVKGIQIHDQREKGYSHSNPDIDFDRADLNKDLHNSEKINFTQRVKERIQKLSLPRAVRKDAIVMCQCLITSDKGFFEGLSPEDQDRFFQEGYAFIKGRYGEENMLSATIHYDEKTPHLHVNFVPVTPDGRLCAKDLFKRSDLIQLHDDFWRFCNEKGFRIDRGDSKGERKEHLSVADFKLKNQREEIQENEAYLARLKAIKKQVSVELEKGPLGYPAAAVEDLKAQAEKQRLENLELKTMVQKQNDMIKTLQNRLKTAESKLQGSEHLHSELKTLRSESQALEDYLQKNTEAAEKLTRFMSFKKQVHTEGDQLVQLKAKYMEISEREVGTIRKLQETVEASRKIQTTLPELEKLQHQLLTITGELEPLKTRRKELDGKIDFMNPFRIGDEKKVLDGKISGHQRSLEGVASRLMTVYKVDPEGIDGLKAVLGNQAVMLQEQETVLRQNRDKLEAAKKQLAFEYKYYAAKTSLYSEPYRAIVEEKLKLAPGDFKTESELRRISPEDRKRIREKLPEGMKAGYAERITCLVQRKKTELSR